jgi:hypothetical protein
LEIIKRSDIRPIKDDKGREVMPWIIPTTWAFKIKRWPDGMMRKIKACLCV